MKFTSKEIQRETDRDRKTEAEENAFNLLRIMKKQQPDIISDVKRLSSKSIQHSSKVGVTSL